jgi:hypothetical protein
MQMPIPSDGHRKLEKIAGQWEGEEMMHPSPWDPQGGKATGRIRSRVALSGFALIYDYEQERDGKITFTGHGVFTFDSKDDLYTLDMVRLYGRAPGSLQRKVRRRCPKTCARWPGDARAPDLRPARSRLSND